MLLAQDFYAYMVYYYMFDDNKDWMLVVITVLSWVRGITLFTLLTSTRYMIGLIGEVLIDIIPFAAVVFYSIVAFFFINLTIGDQSTPPSLSMSLVQSYFDAIGNFSVDEYDVMQYIIVLLASVFNLIIMMNLLISIIGTTYGRVNDAAQVEDLKQLTNLVIEAESLLFFKRSYKNKTVLQICEEYTPPEVVASTDLKLRFRTVRSELNGLFKLTNSNQKENKETNAKILAKHEQSLSKIDNMRKDIVADLKTSIEELRKQLLENMQKSEEPVDENKKLFMCLNGHNLKENIVYERCCDICRNDIDNVEAFNCNICDFDMCLACALYYYNHNEVKTTLTCHEGHVLLHFHEINEVVTEKNYDEQNCRMCGVDFEGEGFHCLVCMYSVCKGCNSIYEEAGKSKEKSQCKSKHTLK